MQHKLVDLASEEKWFELANAVAEYSKEEIDWVLCHNGNTLIEELCSKPDGFKKSALKYLLDQGVDPDGYGPHRVKGKDEKPSPLMLLLDEKRVDINRVEMVQSILDAGADPNIDYEKSGHSLIARMDLRVYFGFVMSDYDEVPAVVGLLESLLQKGARVDLRDAEINAPNPIIAQLQKSDTLALLKLLEYHPDVLALKDAFHKAVYKPMFMMEGNGKSSKNCGLAVLGLCFGLGVPEGFSIRKQAGLNEENDVATYMVCQFPGYGDKEFRMLDYDSPALNFMFQAYKGEYLDYTDFLGFEYGASITEAEQPHKYDQAESSMVKIITNIVANRFGEPNSFALEKGTSINVYLGSALRHAAKNNIDLSDILISQRTGATNLAKTAIQSGFAESLIYFGYWKNHPEIFEKVLDLARSLKNVRDNPNTQKDIKFTDEQHQELLDFGVNLRGVVAAEKSRVAVQSVSLGSSSEMGRTNG